MLACLPELRWAIWHPISIQIIWILRGSIVRPISTVIPCPRAFIKFVLKRLRCDLIRWWDEVSVHRPGWVWTIPPFWTYLSRAKASSSAILPTLFSNGHHATWPIPTWLSIPNMNLRWPSYGIMGWCPRPLLPWGCLFTAPPRAPLHYFMVRWNPLYCQGSAMPGASAYNRPMEVRTVVLKIRVIRKCIGLGIKTIARPHCMYKPRWAAVQVRALPGHLYLQRPMAQAWVAPIK